MGAAGLIPAVCPPSSDGATHEERIMSDVRVDIISEPLEVIDGWELTDQERKEFDYLDWTAIDDGRESATFFRRNGEVHDLGEFCRTWGMNRDGDTQPEWMRDWDGYRADSYFSALLVRFVDEDGQPATGECSHVIVGLALS
jgi:hypothetical protein